ncbi:MAG: pyridoxamine 5'-phosphate oxidase [Bacteroidetes bacterium]|nr:pyridoxamine 5'-phosphate oxidase [Bacteroidota bacterium]
MKDNISNLRKEYGKHSLDIKDVDKNPLKQFSTWFEQSLKSGVDEPNAMNIATVDQKGRPSSRTVLLKGVDESGFLFFTNYNSRKGNQINENPYASIVFLWLELQRQVIIEGRVEKISDSESDEYYNSRPFQSRIGAWASEQSKEIDSREELEQKFAELEKTFKDKNIPRPKYWGGYRLIPDRIEFWQGRESRLHDRIVYILENHNWKIKRLSP